MRKRISKVLFFVFVLGTLTHVQLNAQNVPSPLKSPQRLHHHLNPGEATQRIQAAISLYEFELQRILEIPSEMRGFQNTIEALEFAGTRFSHSIQPVLVLKYVSPSKELRDEILKAKKEILDPFQIAFSLRKDVYDAFMAAHKNTDIGTLSAAEKRLFELMHDSFKDSAARLPDEAKKEYQALSERSAQLTDEFDQAVNENADQLILTAEDLEGVPQSVLDDLPKTDTGYAFRVNNIGDMMALTEHARNPETRKKIYLAWASQLKDENLPRLQASTGAALRRANMLDYPSHAVRAAAQRRMTDPKDVVRFLVEIGAKAQKGYQEELRMLLSAKEEDNSSEKTLDPWDVGYYDRILKERNFKFDEEAFRAYLPHTRVVSGTLETLSELFGLKFIEDPTAKTWDPLVLVFDVMDANLNQLRFKLYLDLFYRPGKQGGAFAYPVIEAGRLPDGTYQSPTILVVGNFPPPEIEKRVSMQRSGANLTTVTETIEIVRPALLRPDNLRTLFHELGHALHMGRTNAEYASYAGSNVPMDWVEVHSQLLEHWRLVPNVRNKISSHYKTGEPLPQEMVNSLEEVLKFGASRFTKRQVFYAVFDLLLNGPETPEDLQGLWNGVSEIILGKPDLPGTARAATFHHLMTSHYKGAYCSYMLCEVVADFIYDWIQRKTHGTQSLSPLHPLIGERLLQYLYTPGHFKPTQELLDGFLAGAPVTPDPFLTDKGIPLDQDPAHIQAEIEKTMKRLGGISGCEYLLD